MGRYPTEADDEGTATRVLRAVPIVLYSMAKRNGNWTVTWASDNSPLLLGVTPREMIACPDWWSSYLHPEDRRRTLVAADDIATGEVGVLEYRFRHPSGRDIWLRDRRRVVFGPDGEAEVLGGWVGIALAHAGEEERERLVSQLETLTRRPLQAQEEAGDST